jgi:hypothetical protein
MLPLVVLAQRSSVSVADYSLTLTARLWFDRTAPMSCVSSGATFEPTFSVTFTNAEDGAQFSRDGFAVRELQPGVQFATLNGSTTLMSLANKTHYKLHDDFAVVSSCVDQSGAQNETSRASFVLGHNKLAFLTRPFQTMLEGRHTLDPISNSMNFINDLAADFALVPNFTVPADKTSSTPASFWETYRGLIVACAVVAVVLLLTPLAALFIWAKIRSSRERYKPINMD